MAAYELIRLPICSAHQYDGGNGSDVGQQRRLLARCSTKRHDPRQEFSDVLEPTNGSRIGSDDRGFNTITLILKTLRDA